MKLNCHFLSLLIDFLYILYTEELALVVHKELKKDWERDFDKLICPLIENDVPCFILYRLDTKTPLGYAWLLVSWIPDTATIRSKMLYASTKATLKLEFGSAHIKEEFHATSLVRLGNFIRLD